MHVHAHRHTQQAARGLENSETCAQLWASGRLSVWESSLLQERKPQLRPWQAPAGPQAGTPWFFQTNRRDNFYQRDLEEKMVHKVTMDTVRIITSSVSGMTNVSWHTGLAHWG